MKKFLVLDVEGYSDCRPYDLGFIVTDKNGTEHEAHSVGILPACYENLERRLERLANPAMETPNEMAHRNIREIMTETDGKYLVVRDIDKLYYAFLGVIEKHDIKRIWAYNCAFDRGALNRLFGDERFSIIDKRMQFCDIIPAITHTHLLSADYINFCKENGFVTAKGNIKTTAEIVFRYLSGNIAFEEAHTGLEDVRIEKQILLKAMEKTKSPHYKPIAAWKIIREFCVVNGIELPIPSFEDMVSD